MASIIKLDRSSNLKFTYAYLIPVTAIALRLSSPVTADISYLFLAVFALFGRAQAIQALALSWLFTMFSSGIAPDAAYANIGRYAVIAGASFSVFVRSSFFNFRVPFEPYIKATLGLGVFIILHSVLFSNLIDVSILKAVSWTVVMVTLFSAWSRLPNTEAEALENWLLVGLILIMITSLPFLVLPQGYLRNGTGFQGILNHPQAFGPTMSLLAAWIFSRTVSRYPPPWLSIATGVVALVFVVMSETRTAGVALVFGIIIALLSKSFFQAKSLFSVAPAFRSLRFQGLLFLTVLSSFTAGAHFSDLVTNYITKSGRAEVSGLIEAYDLSRGRLMDDMWLNIEENPWSGIGFGIPSSLYDFQVVRDPLFDLPISATVEKGVVPLMVLEELGVIGAFFVLLWLWLLVRNSYARGTTELSVLLVAFFINFGEAILFSPGGMGLLLLVLISWAVAKPVLSTR